MKLESFGKDTISTIFGCKLRNVTDNTIKEFTDFFKNTDPLGPRNFFKIFGKWLFYFSIAQFSTVELLNLILPDRRLLRQCQMKLFVERKKYTGK